MTEIFDELCPVYMAYGMTYDQFWYGDPWMVRAFAQAHLLKRKILNENMWIQGAYIANAVTTAIVNTFGKKQMKYMEKPMELFEKTEAEKAQEIREERQKLIDYLTRLKASSARVNKQGVDQDGNKP